MTYEEIRNKFNKLSSEFGDLDEIERLFKLMMDHPDRQPRNPRLNRSSTKTDNEYDKQLHNLK